MVSGTNVYCNNFRRTDSVLEKVLGWGCAYVRPVERLMPARKAETVDGFSMRSTHYWRASTPTQYCIECIVC